MDADPLPRDREDDYSEEMAARRRDFVRARAGTGLDHVGAYSLDPAQVRGNVEGFIGVAQVPIGVAGPLLVDGEHARGDHYVPLATTEGTLVASYNRGMKLVRAAGGVTTTVMDDRMQRAPAFVFPSARQARDFGVWLTAHHDDLAAAAEATTTVGRLLDVQQFTASRILFTRFNFSTGDAAGQNMTGKATAAACAWIMANYPGIERFYLESNVATDKKASQMNMLHTRGKRVVAEVTLPADLVRAQVRTTTDRLFGARLVANLGGMLAGVNNNGNHTANALAALFIATGQDVANVAEAAAGYGFSELLPNGDYYASVTLPSLIVATYGGGTGLPTQRECLQMLGCYGPGRVHALAEIVAATVLAGELSLGSAVVAEEWVAAHDRLGRNRP